MKIVKSVLVLSAAALLASAPLAAQAPGFKAEVLVSMDATAKKIVDLAAAMPADSFGWRPMEGVRSVSETYMHIASANYFFAGMFGLKTPEGVDARALEKTVTSKAEVVEVLKKSIAHQRKAVEGLSDEELSQPMKLFGRDSSKTGALLSAAGHLNEHLGQAIAYARSNKVVPPWSK